MRKIYIISCLFMIFISGCSKSEEDFKKATWGMTIEEVIQLENKNGNVEYDSGNSRGYEYITYEEQVINEKNAIVEYTFANEITQSAIFHEFGLIYRFQQEKELNKLFKSYGLEYDVNKFMRGENGIDQLKEDERREILEKVKEIANNYNEFSFNDIIFDDFYLVKGTYEFEDKESEIKELLINKYGAPYVNGEHSIKWILDRKNIEYNLNSNIVSYTINSNGIEDIMKSIEKRKKEKSVDGL